MKNLVVWSASACLVLLLNYAAAAVEPDYNVAGAGGTGGNAFSARCPVGQHLLGFNLRAGHNIDAIQPICGVPVSETQVQVQGEMPRYGGTGGEPVQVICPTANMAVPTPVVLGLSLAAEGREGKVLNEIGLLCGIVASQQRMPQSPAALHQAPWQEGADMAFGFPKCPPGMIGVGVFGRAGALVDSLGLICGTAQTNFTAAQTAGHTLGKRKKTAGKTGPALSICEHAENARRLNLPVAAALEAKCRAASAKAVPSLGKKRAGAGAATSSAASQGALAEARAGVDPAIYDQYVGRYLASSSTYTVSRDGNRLYLARPDKTVELIPQSETDFVISASGAVVRFNKSPEGRVVSMSMFFSDQEALYWREGEKQPSPKILNPF